MHMRRILATALVGVLASPLMFAAASRSADREGKFDRDDPSPIRHIVVIFNENISFDHYFATYPRATNPAGEPAFTAEDGTPAVNGLVGSLLTNNPNFQNTANAAGAANPFRLDRSQALTADQGHNYLPEQEAFDHGLMDLFPASTGTAGSPPTPPPSAVQTRGLVMGYYDGNTVTALWNYAQHFALNDNSYSTNFGPSTVGALNLISGQTNGVINNVGGLGTKFIADGGTGLTIVGDADPLNDVCKTSSTLAMMSGKNVGDLLTEQNLTWGWFQGGFNLALTNANGTTGCARSTASAVVPTAQADYVPHHEPFQFYASTQNPTHARPTSVGNIGYNDAANHQYDINDFYAAVQNGNMPAVSFLKPIAVQNAHPGNSDPLDEQAFVVHVINFLESTREWDSTVVIIAYDDSDGWYDHQMGPTVNQSETALDALSAPGQCGTTGATAALPGLAVAHAQGRCGYGPRQPLLVISPFARRNFVDDSLTDQTSILRFIEDNFLAGQRIGDGSFDAVAGSLWKMLDLDDNRGDFNRKRNDRLFLSETTGEPVAPPQGLRHQGASR